MELNNNNSEQLVNQHAPFVAHLLLNQKMSAEEVKTTLVEKGVHHEAAVIVIENVQHQIKKAKKERGQKDMLYGALWFIGGTIATFANIGFIFWGAMVFGAVQFIKGVVNSL
jgi:hypothetical protein